MPYDKVRPHEAEPTTCTLSGHSPCPLTLIATCRQILSEAKALPLKIHTFRLGSFDGVDSTLDEHVRVFTCEQRKPIQYLYVYIASGAMVERSSGGPGDLEGLKVIRIDGVQGYLNRVVVEVSVRQRLYSRRKSCSFDDACEVQSDETVDGTQEQQW